MFSRQFKFRQKNFLGIDIGTRSLRMIELSHEKNNHKLENYALIPLQSQNEATIIATIKASLKNTKTNKAAFAFAHSAIIYQQIINKFTNTQQILLFFSIFCFIRLYIYFFLLF